MFLGSRFDSKKDIKPAREKTTEAEFNPGERQHTIRFRQQECRQREREIKKGRETKKDREVERERRRSQSKTQGNGQR